MKPAIKPARDLALHGREVRPKYLQDAVIVIVDDRRDRLRDERG